MKALITNAVMTLLDDQIVNVAEKGIIDELYGLIPLGYLCFHRFGAAVFGVGIGKWATVGISKCRLRL